MPNYHVHFKAIGTTIRAWLNVPDTANAAVLQQVPAWFELVEASLSRFRASSELCYLNAHAGQWVRVMPMLFQVVQAAVQAAEMTGGVVNPLILPALEAAGYDHSFDATDFTPGIHPAVAIVPDWCEIQLDAEESCIYLPPGARIDLGGIAKGWAVQQIANRLAQIGPCLVDAGGDMVARGKPAESEIDGWFVTVPIPGEAPRCIRLKDAAVATSGVDYRRWIRDGKEFHHLIDPRTGEPARSPVFTATVVAPDAVYAEAWAKVSLITGSLPDLDVPFFLVCRNGSSTSNRLFQDLWR